MLKYEDSENKKADRVNTAVFYLRQIKRRALFLNTRKICRVKMTVHAPSALYDASNVTLYALIYTKTNTTLVF